MTKDPRLSRIISGIPPSGIRKFFDLANEMKGEVISLSIGEPDFVTPWHIREKGILSLEQGKTHYSPNSGYMSLRKAISEYLDRKFSMSYSPDDEIVVTVGGSEAIDAAIRAIIDPGDEVIIPEPCFVSYKACVSLSGGVPVVLDCKKEDGFVAKADDLRKKITDKTKLIILGYPANPTGVTFLKEDILDIAKLAVEKDLLVISDELYAEIIYDGIEHYSISRAPGMRERTVVINGFSKAFAMTGWRIGYAAGPPELISAINRIHQYVIMSSPTTAQYAAIEALKNGDESVEKMRSEYDKRRKVIMAALKEADLDFIPPSGAFYAFPDIRSTGMTSSEFCERFLMEKKVAIVPGSAFGDSGEGYVRISYAASMENIEAAMERLIEFVAESREDV